MPSGAKCAKCGAPVDLRNDSPHICGDANRNAHEEQSDEVIVVVARSRRGSGIARRLETSLEPPPLNVCPQCGTPAVETAIICSTCGHLFIQPETEAPQPVEFSKAKTEWSIVPAGRKQVMGFIGGLLLLFGLFTPIIRVSSEWNIGYFSYDASLAWFLAALSVLALICSTLRRYRWLSWIGVFALAPIVYSFLTFRSRLQIVQEMVERRAQVSGDPIGVSIVNSIQFQFGWGVLIAGAVILILAGELRKE